MVVLRVLNI